MARVIRTRSQYDLTKTFSDNAGNIYSNKPEDRGTATPPFTYDNLRLWMRMNSSSPTDLSMSGLSPTYDNSPNVQIEKIGNVLYSTAEFNDTLDQAAEVTSTSGLLSFSSIGSGGTPSATSDRPFTISAWVKTSSLSTQRRLFSKKSSNVTLTAEYEAYISQSGATAGAVFTLYDAVNGGQQQIYVSESKNYSDGQWRHFVFTYDGSGGSTASGGMKIYVDGVLLSSSTNNSGTYRGMQPAYTQPLYVGQDSNASNQIDARMAEFAVWNKQLTSTEVLTIYNGTKNLVTLLTYISGFDVSISTDVNALPPRALIRENDSENGKYPTIFRTGDKDFSGRASSYYDDANTLNYYNNILSSPGGIGGKPSQSLLGLRRTNPTENISPYSDARISFDSTVSGSFITGTNARNLPGFDQRLNSKASLTFNIDPSSSTDVFFSTGTSGPEVVNSTSRIGSGLAYYNWSLKKWEMIGDTRNGVRTGSNVDFINPDPTIRSATPHAFTGIPEFGAAPQLVLTARHMGRPHSTHGFPFASQFDPTGSQVLSLSSSLSHPFLLESAEVNFSASFHPYPSSTLSDGPLTYNFFLLDISPVDDSVTIVQDLSGSVTGLPGTFTTRNQNFSVNYVKNLAWTGEIARVYSALYDSNPISYGRDLNLITFGADGDSIPAVTGSFKVLSPARIYGKNDGLVVQSLRYSSYVADRPVPLLANKIGFRNMAGYTEGKSYIRSVTGAVLSGTFNTSAYSGLGNYRYVIPQLSSLSNVSPYVLMPGHKLVLGFSCTPIQGAANGTGAWSEPAMSSYITTLSPGAGTLTLYGSFLRNGEFTNPENNQPLTSDAVHEDLHYDNPVFDQFDVESYETFTGSYIDDYITGSMLASLTGNPNVANVRKVQASTVSGVSGSFQRFVKINSIELYYDSVLRFFTASDGSTFLQPSSNYGLAAGQNLYTNYKFRRDRSGQFRDMLEQAQYTSNITRDKQSIERPIEIRFYSRASREGAGVATTDPMNTHTQNLSNYATSSVPYFDGFARERPDNPDRTITDVYVG